MERIIGHVLFFVLILGELGLIILLALYVVSTIQSFLAGAPYVPISRKLVWQLLRFGRVGPTDVLYDLGCGDARVLLGGVRQCGVRRAVGYEVSWWPYLKAKFLIRRSGLGNQVTLYRRNFLGADLSDATVIFLYLFPKLVDRAARYLAGSTKPGIRILCASFPIDHTRRPGFRLLQSEKIGTITAYLYERI